MTTVITRERKIDMIKPVVHHIVYCTNIEIKESSYGTT